MKAIINSLTFKCRMKYYPFKEIEGTLLELSDNNLKIAIHKKYKRDVLDYMPKTFMIKYSNEEGESVLFGEGNPIEIKDGEHLIIINFMIGIKTYIENETFRSIKRCNLMKASESLPNKLYL